MPTSEDVVLSKILSDKKAWESVLDRGIGKTFFEQRRREFLFVQGFYNEHGELPALDVMQKYHPAWEPVTHENNLDFWVTELQSDRDLRVQNTHIEEWFQKKKDGASIKELNGILTKMNIALLEGNTSSRDIDLNNIEAELREFKERKNKEGVMGLPFGITRLDKQTGGARGGDLGVLMGPPKNLKTWLQLYCGWNMWTHGDGSPGLLISKEMDEKQMRVRMRWFDLRSVPYQMFRNAQLGQYEEEYYKLLDRIKGTRKPFIVSADDGDMDTGSGVSLIAAKIDRYRPSFVLIDGGYLISDDRGENDWRGIKNVFRDLKRLARRKQVPILVTTQPQRLKEKDNAPLKRKLTMEDVGGSYSIAQDCDYMIGVRRIGRDMLENYIIGIREGDLDSWQMRFDLDMGIIKEVSGEEELREEDMNFEFEDVKEEISGSLLF